MRVQFITWTLVGLAALSIPLPATVSLNVATAAPIDDFNYAAALYKKKRWEASATAFREFLKANPRHERAPFAQLYLGLALVNQNDFKTARSVLQDYVQRYPKSDYLPDALYRVGECSYYLNDSEAADTQLREFLKKYPDHALRQWALPYLGDTQLRLNRPAQAIPFFDKALEDYPQGRLQSDAALGLARAYKLVDKPKEAKEYFQKLTADPRPGYGDRALQGLASLSYEAGEYEQSAKLFEQLIEKYPESDLIPTARLNAGFSHYRLEQFQEAAKHFNEAVKTPEQKDTATYWEALSLTEAGQTQPATKLFIELVKPGSSAPPDLQAESYFQLGEFALAKAQYADASKAFVGAVEALPNGPRAAEAAYFAAQSRMSGDDMPTALQLATRFEQDYSKSEYAAENALLFGRIWEQQATEEGIAPSEKKSLREKALDRYREVATANADQPIALKAHYYEAAMLEQLERYEESLVAAEKVIPAFQPMDDASRTAVLPYIDIFTIAARSALAIEKWDTVVSIASAYLNIAPSGDDADVAYATRALAHMALKQSQPALEDWQRLQAISTDKDLIYPVAIDLAERFYNTNDWANAEKLFASASENAPTDEPKAEALAGVGWSQFEQENFAPAAKSFGEAEQLAAKDSAVITEAAYMRGRALDASGDKTAAAEAYAHAFETYRPKNAAKQGAEAESSLRNVYLSGLQQARTWRELKNVEKASQAYEATLVTFPNPANLDRLLDEWALLHYEAGQFDKADALFQRLIDSVPESPLAQEARLSLAESGLVNGQVADAVATLKSLTTTDNVAPSIKERAMYLLIGLSSENSRWAELIALAEQFLKSFPDSPDATAVAYQLADAAVQTGKLDLAETAIKQVLAAPEDSLARKSEWFPRVWILAAEVGHQRGDLNTVEKAVERLAALPEQPVYAYQVDQVLGQAYLKKARFDDARAAFQKVLDAPNSRLTITAARAQYGIAQTYFLQENWKESQAAAFRAYSLYQFPEIQAPALLMVARSDEALGNTKAAMTAYADVIKEFPDTPYAKEADPQLKRLQPKS
ncbi:tetratricopeptide repeat protein [Calycomorphotria hydatis]|nr:tetratricopeptide repeat protein [Calycomorphotria hydatis]